MAVFETNLNTELLKPLKVHYLEGNLFSQDVQSNQINVAVFKNGEPEAISGSVSADVIRPDGGTVVATGGTIEGNVASITLPEQAYYIAGMISIVVKLTTSGVVTSIGAVVANVYQSSTDTVIDTGTIIPSVQTLITQIETAVASIPADYSSLWTKLAPAFSTDTSYIAGQYVTYDGGLYRFNTNHAGAWVSGDVTAVNIGSELSDIKSAFDLKTTGEYGSVSLGTITTGKYIRQSDGNESSSIAWDHTNYIPVYGGKLLFTCPESDNSSAVEYIAAVAFYSSNTLDSFISSVPINLGTVGKTSWKCVDAPNTAQFMRLTIATGKENEYTAYNLTVGALTGSFANIGIIGITDANNFEYNKIYARTNLSQELNHIPYDTWLGMIMTLSFRNMLSSASYQIAISKNAEMHIRRTWSSNEDWSEWTLIPNESETVSIADKRQGIVGRYTGAFTSDEQYINVPITLKANKTYVVKFKGTRTGTITIYPTGYGTDYKYLRTYNDQVTLVNDGTDRTLTLYNTNNTRDSFELVVYEAEAVQNRKYIVDKDSHSGDYTSLTKCLLDLKDDMSPKTIEIWEGDYDIYQEYVDAEVPIYTGDNPSAYYYDYCVWIPSNTHIIGKGIVRLKWMPLVADTDITAPQSKTVSPVNVGGSVILENVEVHCKNGRYCLHNDPSGVLKYTGAIQKYINCKFYKYENETLDGTTLGFSPTTGFCLDRSMQHIYENCIFVNELSDRAFYGHRRGTIAGTDLTEAQSSSITLTGCAFVTDGVRGIKFGNGSNDNIHIPVLFNNCMIDGKIVSVNETETDPTTYKNAFDMTFLNCGDVTIEIADPDNMYPPKAYRTNLTVL